VTEDLVNEVLLGDERDDPHPASESRRRIPPLWVLMLDSRNVFPARAGMLRQHGH
jgi:hypothetical protein